ncbi:ABC transporter ATP-binding protein [Brooklawnia cerclae]|uniref:Peptide/nickel transport system ATP-binding protein n=1 Tax=Brooklawnia cerclae TaxID=349934 RepID=A0ABX0SI89_9ACTN|nr:ABC transporter ATP-binding protein [Brooklawnia cerclae]NIH58059.1 peptide/nickel transport system ATP-binding protein [Brooklawnia cerclae]
MAPESDGPLLRVAGLTVGFGEPSAPVVDDLHFDVTTGETVALVGESGSGKTMTAMSVLGLLPPTATVTGSVRLAGKEVIGAPEDQLRAIRGRSAAMIFQEPMTAFNPVYTVGRQIVDALRARERISRAEAMNRAVDLLRRVGIPEPERRAKSYPHELSGGQRQRAMIALAISGNPSLLIADEPTTALDVTVQAEILALMKGLQRDLGMAILLITHDMGVVAEMADRVVVMKDGIGVEQADVFELFEAPRNDYTRALLEAVPRPGVGGRLHRLSVGEPARAEGEDESPALEVSHLSVRYPGKFLSPGFLAVNDVSLTIPRGQVLGLVGESGSGKSTIGKTIAGLLRPESGTVTVAGKDALVSSESRLREIRRNYGMVFQDPASSLNPRNSIGQSIAEPLLVHARSLTASQRQARVNELLEQVELPVAWHVRFPHELSGGQRQRVGIARALAANPHLLIADEPTSALDVSVQAAVLELFQRLQRDLGFSCLFISHDLAVVEILADRVAVLADGALVEEGDAEQVLRSPVTDYTKRLIAAAPVPDPRVQRARAAARIETEAAALTS